MENENLNATETEEVVQPQSSAVETEEIAAPQAVDVNQMSDDEFNDYLSKLAQDGATPNTSSMATPSPNEEGSEDAPDKEGTAEPAEEENETQPFKTFNTQEDYQAEIDRIVSKRYGELRQRTRSELDLFDKVKAQARNFYGDAADDNAAVAELIADLQQQNADSRNISLEDYNKNMQEAEDARRYREMRGIEAERQAQIADIQNRWKAESESLREIIPDFDFQKALENKTFYAAIEAGKSVHMAYMLANKQAEAEKASLPPKRKPITQVAQQKGGTAGKTHVNIDTMTDEEFDKYISEHMKE